MAFAVAIGGAVVGGIVGSFFGALSIGIQLGFLAGSLLGSYLFPQELPDVIGPRVQDLQVTSSAAGRPLPLIIGTLRAGGNVIWSPGLREVRKEEEVEAEKSTPSQTVVTYEYFLSAAVAICEGEADVLKIWANGKLIYTWEGTGPEANEKFAGKVRRYRGTLSQEPESIIQAAEGVSNVPAYLGVCYVVFDDIPVADFGNIAPQFTFKVTSNSSPQYPYTTFNMSYSDRTLMRLDPSKRYAYVYTINGDDKFDKWDLATQQRVWSRTIPVETANGVDEEAILWHIDEGPRFFWAEERNQLSGLVFLMTDEYGTRMVQGSVKASGIGDHRGGVVMVSGAIGDQTCVMTWQTDDFGTSWYTVYRVYGTVDVPIAIESADISIDDVFGTSDINIRDGNGWCRDNAGNLYQFIAEPYVSPTNSYLCRWSTGGLLDTQIDLGVRARNPYYEPTTNTILFLQGNGKIGWYDLNDNSQGEISSAYTMSQNGQNRAALNNGPYPGGEIWLQSDSFSYDFFVKFNFRTRTSDISTIRLDTQFGIDEASSPWIDVYGGSIGLFDGDLDQDWYWIYPDRLTSVDVTDQTIIELLSSRAGYNVATEIDASAMTTTRHGYVVDRTMPVGEAIKPILDMSISDVVESDFEIKYVPRGGSVAVIIPEEDLGAHSDTSDPVPPFIETHEDPIELPREIEVTFLDQSKDYLAGSYSYQLHSNVITSDRKITVNLPVAMTNGKAAGIAQRLMREAYRRKTQYRLPTTWEYLPYDPTDVIQWQSNNRTYTGMVVKSTYGADGLLVFDIISESFGNFTPDIVGQEQEGIQDQEIVLLGESFWYVLDLPLLRDIDEETEPVVYALAGSQSDQSAWPGAQIIRSLDGGGSFSVPYTFFTSDQKTVHGSLGTTLPAPDLTQVFDRTNTVDLILSNDDGSTLSSVTELDVLSSDVNAILVGNPTTGWELMQFVNITPVSGYQFTLDTLLRGQRNTEDLAVSHPANDTVIFLGTNTTSAEILETAQLGKDVYFQGITNGLTSGTIKSVTSYEAQSKKPWSPTHLTSSQDGAGEWTFTGVRRARIGGNWTNTAYGDLPNVQNGLAFEVDVYTDSTYTTVQRTLTSTATASGSVVTADLDGFTATYTVTDQTSDFGGAQDVLYVEAFQTDTVYGRGKGTRLTAAAEPGGVLPLIYGSATGTGTTSTTVNVPAGTLNGDLLLGVFAQADSSGVDGMSVPAGWTELTDGATVNVSNVSTLFFYRYVAEAALEPASYNFTSTHSGISTGIIVGIRGTAQDPPILDMNYLTTRVSNVYDHPAISCPTSPGLAFWVNHLEAGNTGNPSATGFTTIANANSGTSSGVTSGIGYKNIFVPQTVPAFTSTTTFSTDHQGWSFFLRSGGYVDLGKDPYWSNVVLLVSGDGTDASTTFTDEARGQTLTAQGSAQVDTGFFKFGTAAMLLDGVDSRVDAPQGSNWTFGDADFTIEFWARVTGGGGDGFITRGTSGTGRWVIYLTSTGGIQFYNGGTLLMSTGGDYRDSTWHHIAVTRKDGTSRIFVDGTQATSTGTSYTITADSSVLQIGNDPSSGGRYLQGSLDEIRITKGAGRYTSNFPIPTSPWPRS